MSPVTNRHRSEVRLLGPKEPTSRAYLLVSAVALAGYFALPGERPNQIAYLLFGWAAVVALAVAGRRQPRGQRLFFVLFALGVLSFTIGDAVWASYRVIRNVDPPYPSPGDVFWLGSYAFWGAALLALLRGRARTRDRGGLIDAAIIFTGIGLVQWIFLINPHLSSPQTPLLIRLTSAAYPAADLILLAIAARLFVSPGAKTPAFRYLMGSFMALLVADATYGVYVLHSPYHRGNPIDAGWLGAYILFAVAALHPSMRTLATPVDDEPSAPSRRRLVVLTAISLVAPSLVIADRYTPGGNTTASLGVGAAVLFLLVLTRMAGLVGELRSSNAELARAQQAREHLLRRTVRAGEDERLRLAADLHDGPIQRLSALSLYLEQLRRRLPDGTEETRLLEESKSSLSLEIRRLRRMMTELRPPALDEEGLNAALRDHAFGVCRAARIRLRDDLRVDGRLPVEIETLLYRVAQEALANVARHAQATEVSIFLGITREGVRLTVTDDGVGFEPHAKRSAVPFEHFGLVSMRERVELSGGSWAVRSTPGKGTTVDATIPLAQEGVA